MTSITIPKHKRSYVHWPPCNPLGSKHHIWESSGKSYRDIFSISGNRNSLFRFNTIHGTSFRSADIRVPASFGDLITTKTGSHTTVEIAILVARRQVAATSEVQLLGLGGTGVVHLCRKASTATAVLVTVPGPASAVYLGRHRLCRQRSRDL
jgi:hypothetical protein